MTQSDYLLRKALLNANIAGFMQNGMDGWANIYEMALYAKALCLAPSDIFKLGGTPLVERSRNQDEQPQFVCADCGKGFETKEKLNAHRGGKNYSKTKLK